MVFGVGWFRRCAPWSLLVVVSLTLHLWVLGERAYHHDEAIHAHRPSSGNERDLSLRSDLPRTAALLSHRRHLSRLLGDSDFTARLPIALAGVAARRGGLRSAAAPRWTGRMVDRSSGDLLADLRSTTAASSAWTCSRCWWRRRPWLRRGGRCAGADAPGSGSGSLSGLAFATKENCLCHRAPWWSGSWPVLLAVTGLSEPCR